MKTKQGVVSMPCFIFEWHGIFSLLVKNMLENARWLIGCSGFSYKDWRPAFYPTGLGATKWLNYYSQHFDTMESNVTFYRLPELKTFHKWVQETPDNFVFSVKAPRTITHYKKFTGTNDIIKAFYDLLQNGLGEKLGAVLFQLPPSFHYTGERLTAILSQLDPVFTNVVEFRHQSWWQEEVFQAFRERNLCFCGVSHPLLTDEVICTSDTIYFRFHGVPDLFRSLYAREYLDRILADIRQFENVRTIYLYFNNNIAATSIDNVKYMQAITGTAPG